MCVLLCVMSMCMHLRTLVEIHSNELQHCRRKWDICETNETNIMKTLPSWCFYFLSIREVGEIGPLLMIVTFLFASILFLGPWKCLSVIFLASALDCHSKALVLSISIPHGGDVSCYSIFFFWSLPSWVGVACLYAVLVRHSLGWGQSCLHAQFVTTRLMWVQWPCILLNAEAMQVAFYGTTLCGTLFYCCSFCCSFAEVRGMYHLSFLVALLNQLMSTFLGENRVFQLPWMWLSSFLSSALPSMIPPPLKVILCLLLRIVS